MEQVLYHGSDDKDLDTDAVNPLRDRFDLCLTSDREIAATYGEHVHEIEFEGYCSTPADVVEVAEEHGLNDGPQRIEEDSPYFYLLLDDERVQDALVEEGHEAVRFIDENIENRTHETIRVLDPSCIKQPTHSDTQDHDRFQARIHDHSQRNQLRDVRGRKRKRRPERNARRRRVRKSRGPAGAHRPGRL